MAVDEHPELVDAVEDLRFAENVVGALDLAGAAEELMQRQHRIVARVIGVVAGRAVDRLALLRMRRAECRNSGPRGADERVHAVSKRNAEARRAVAVEGSKLCAEIAHEERLNRPLSAAIEII